MRLPLSFGIAAVIFAAAAFPVAAHVEPLADPIPEPILTGDLIVAATRFVRAPRTEDSAVNVIKTESMPESST